MAMPKSPDSEAVRPMPSLKVGTVLLVRKVRYASTLPSEVRTAASMADEASAVAFAVVERSVACVPRLSMTRVSSASTCSTGATIRSMASSASLVCVYCLSSLSCDMTCSFSCTTARPRSSAALTVPSAAPIFADAFPKASAALAEVCARDADPSSSAVPVEAVSFPSSVLALSESDATFSNVVERAASDERALSRVSFADRASSAAPDEVVASSARAARASAISARALPTRPAAPDRAASSFVPEAARKSSSASATAPLTVEKNVSLMVVSRVFAPVSVILGATGPVFSFT